MKIRYKITSLLACKNIYIFSAEHPNQAFAFGSVRFGRAMFGELSFGFGGSATALIGCHIFSGQVDLQHGWPTF